MILMTFSSAAGLYAPGVGLARCALRRDPVQLGRERAVRQAARAERLLFQPPDALLSTSTITLPLALLKMAPFIPEDKLANLHN